ncbi:MAG: MATE family efflux transporter [Cyclobacteriaceae bacterium]|nr:MATE family efflux transporter [Cyclobacteriaceae bacterium]
MKIRDIFNQSKITLNLAYPVMLSQLGQVMVGVVDSMMVGQIGKDSLAGASLGNSIFFLILTFGIGISYGVTPLVAKADGENNPSTIINLLKHGFIVNLGSSILLLAVLIITSLIFPYLGQPEQVVVLAVPYFLVISLSVIPFMIFQTIRQFAEGLSLTKQAMMVTVSGNIINILLNYILIFGKLGFPAMGLLGAGIATLIARIIMAVIMIIFVYYHHRFKIYWSHYEKSGVDMMIIRRILSIGLPSGFQFIFEVGAFSLAAIMVGWIGTSALAAHQIAISLASISYMMATGIATATTIRVGNQMGKNDAIMLRKVGFTGFLMGAAFMGISAIALIVLNGYLPTWYIDDQEVINLASRLILIAAVFQISDGLQVVGLGALRGMADVKIPTLVTLLAYWILALPIGYFFGIYLDFGASGIWIGLLTGLTVTAALLIYRFRRISLKIVQGKEPVTIP